MKIDERKRARARASEQMPRAGGNRTNEENEYKINMVNALR